MRQKLVPQVHWKVGVNAAQASEEMVFERSNGPFGSISPVNMRWGKLKINILRAEELFEILGSLIVEAV